MTTVTIQYNKIVFNAVKDNEALLQLSFGEKKLTNLLAQGSPTPKPWTLSVYGLLGTRPHSSGWAAGEQAKFPLAPHHSRCHLSSIHSIPHPKEKLSSTKPVPGAKKVGDHSYKALMSLWGRHPPDFTLFQPLAFLLLHQHTFLAGFGHFYVLVLFYS